MTKKTNQRRRHRAVFLAFIMVVSVFGGAIAFSGSAVADSATDPASAVDSNDDPGASPGETLNFSNINGTFVHSSGATFTAINVSGFGSNGENVTRVRVFNNSTGQILGVDDTVTTNESNVTLNNVGGSVNLGGNTPGNPGDNFSYTVEITFAEDNGTLINESNLRLRSAVFNQTEFGDTGNGFNRNVGPIGDAALSNQLGADTVNVGNVTVNNFEQFSTDERVNLNVSITTPRDNPNGVNESTIDLNVAKNPNAGLNQTNISVVQGGSLNSDVLQDNGTSFDDNENVSINVDIQLPETSPSSPFGGYNVTLASPVEDDGGNIINTTGNISRTNPSEGNVSVDMRPDRFNLVPDNSNPFIDADPSDSVLASEGADLRLTVVDRFGNNLTRNDSEVGDKIEIANISASSGNSGVATNVTANQNNVGGFVPSAPPIQGRPLFVNTSSTTAGNFAIDVLDTGSGNAVTQDSATQTFSARVGGVAVTANRTTLPAVFSEQARIETQLTDGNGNDVPRSGVSISYAISNSSDAGVTRNDTLTTNSSGTATLNISATSAGETLEISAIEQSTGNGFRGTATIDTVPGDISAGNSVFKINGNTQPGNDITSADGVQVDTQHTLNITLFDSNNNLAQNTPVTLSANQSGASFESTSLTTNETGTATTTVTLPETVTTTRINVSAGGFNASATGDASINVTSVAANAAALQFASDSQSLPANQDDVGVTVEVVDTFDNVNTTVTDSVTLTSDDTAVFDFDGSESSNVNLGSGTAGFTVDVGASGTATLTATVANSDINNTSAEFSATGPSSVDVTFSSDVSTSSNANNNTATLSAQLVGPDGSSIAIAGEQISLSASGPAELNQSGDFTPVTNANGLATYQVNATDQTGQTEITANALNFSAASGTGTITTTGPATDVSISFASDSVAQNNTTTVTTAFVDDSDRVVPRSGTITVQTINDVGEVDSGATASNATALANDFEATYTFNASTTESNATLRALAPGIGQTEATINVTGTQQDQPDQPDEVTSDVIFNDNAAPDGATSLTVDSATHDADFVIVAHTATDSDGDGDIQFSNANGNNEIGTKIGSSEIQSNGTQENIVVNLSKNVSAGDNVDSLAEDQQIVMMLHVANESGDTNFGGSVKEADGETPVFDSNFVNVSALDGAAGNADTDGDGDIGKDEVESAIRDFVTEGTLNQDDVQEVIRAFIIG